MGIERARVLEVHGRGAVRAGYLIDDRLVLTAAARTGTGAGSGPVEVRPAGTATWLKASPGWSSPAGCALFELDDPSMLMMPPDGMRWGRVAGDRPVPVAAMGFPPAATRPTWPRDPEQFMGHVVPQGSASLAVTGCRPPADGMAGAALFAGAELVGVLLAAAHAVPVAILAEDPAFVGLVMDGAGAADGLALVPVSTPATAFPIL